MKKSEIKIISLLAGVILILTSSTNVYADIPSAADSITWKDLIVIIPFIILACVVAFIIIVKIRNNRWKL